MKKLTNLEATLIAEGVQEPESDEQYIQAWQHLIDTGLAWSLQGFFGRTASVMIQEGLCICLSKNNLKNQNPQVVRHLELQRRSNYEYI